MPPEDTGPGSAAEWLKRAQGDLALARVPLPKGAFLEDLCYHAQQAAEKALKAVYLDKGFTFRFVHDLEELVTGLKNQGLAVPSEIEESVILTGYATESRYPGLGEPVSIEEYKRVLELSSHVVTWAENLIYQTG